MTAFKWLFLSVLLASCNKNVIQLEFDDYASKGAKLHKSDCQKYELRDRLVPLYYKNTKTDFADFLINPKQLYEKLYPVECGQLQKEAISIVKLEWRTFPGGLGDQKEVVYMEVVIGEKQRQYKLESESDIYWFISGSREDAIKQAIIRIFGDINKISQ